MRKHQGSFHLMEDKPRKDRTQTFEWIISNKSADNILCYFVSK